MKGDYIFRTVTEFDLLQTFLKQKGTPDLRRG